MVEERTPDTQRRETAEHRPVLDVCEDEEARSIVRAGNQMLTILSE
jgi:hypothetical protein